MKLQFALLFGFAVTITSSAIAAEPTSACTIRAATGNTVDGSTLWGEVPMASGQRSATDCDVDQFAWNNFLYMAGDDGTGHPRFMSLAPWFDAMPKKGKPVWPGKYTPLAAKQMLKKLNKLQAGDDFHLLDVNGKTVSYDIRINQDFLNYVSENKLYTKAEIEKAVKAFNADSSKGGIWLPPTTMDSKQSALEIKTSWRDYGKSCPSDIMHCEKDSAGNWWGLIGMHLVQKTPQHGEMIWASFEHIANSPDCAAGGSNPIQQNPGALNANSTIPALKDKTGWNLFNYTTYKSAGGDGTTCTYPQTGSGDTQCLGVPHPSAKDKKWISVNVCRTDQLPPATHCSGATDNLQIASCLNNDVQQNMPASLNGLWKNYQLIGAEYVIWGSTGSGAPLVGCWNFEDGSFSLNCVNDKSGEISVARTGTTNLANTTMETWMQKNMKLDTHDKKLGTLTQQDCFSCHQPTTASYQGDMSHLFGRVQQK